MSCVLGIDPGINGALAFYYPDSRALTIHDMPKIGKEVSAALLSAIVTDHTVTFAVCEDVGSRPYQRGQFNFGRSFGTVLGVLGAHTIEVNLVRPQKWQKHFSLSLKNDRASKNKSRALAARLFASNADQFKRVKDDGRAEAALVALYGAQALGGKQQ